jgi:pterin-4a-carbinolamine dehydratase
VTLTPAEKERCELPSYVQRILPTAQARVGNADRPPVTVRKNEWELAQNPRRLVRRFEFETLSALLTFLTEVFQYENTSNHTGVHTVEGLTVTIEVMTKVINDVTQSDIDYTREVNDILLDMEYGLGGNDVGDGRLSEFWP